MLYRRIDRIELAKVKSLDVKSIIIYWTYAVWLEKNKFELRPAECYLLLTTDNQTQTSVLT